MREFRSTGGRFLGRVESSGGMDKGRIYLQKRRTVWVEEVLEESVRMKIAGGWWWIAAGVAFWHKARKIEDSARGECQGDRKVRPIGGRGGREKRFTKLRFLSRASTLYNKTRSKETRKLYSIYTRMDLPSSKVNGSKNFYAHAYTRGEKREWLPLSRE